MTRSPLRQLAFVHEFGHALDWFIFGGGTGYSTNDPGSPLLPVINVYLQTPTGQRLIARASGGKAPGYFLEPREIWARAYAQFIAGSVSYARLTREFAIRAQASTATGTPYILPDEEFGSVSTAILDLFGDLGWLPTDNP